MSSSSLCHHFGSLVSFFFFNDTATTEIYTLSLHDALPISRSRSRGVAVGGRYRLPHCQPLHPDRSEEHTSELQSHSDLVCRLLLEKKKNYSLSNGLSKPVCEANAVDCRVS